MADSFTDLACEIDGKPVKYLQNYRVQSPVFSAVLPEGNIYGQEPGLFMPCVDDGYYLMVAPLPVGKHTIHFHGVNWVWTTEGNREPVVLDVTYNLTVAPARK
jgi:hypothetical protein